MSLKEKRMNRFFGQGTMRQVDQPAEPIRTQQVARREAVTQAPAPTPQPIKTAQPETTSSVTEEAGKVGTITSEEFKFLQAMVDKYGPELIISKVGKMLKRRADELKREFTRSIVAKAYEDLYNKIEGLF